MRTRTPQQGRIQDFSEGGAPYEKWGGGGGGGAIRFRSDIMGGEGVITAKIHTPYSIIRGGGGVSEVWGGGGREVGGGGGVMQCYRLWQGKKASPSSIPYQSQSHAIPLETNPFPLWAYKQMAS